MFRSATNLIALENMKLMMQRNAVLEGPGTEGAAGGTRPAASAAASRAFARASGALAAKAEAEKAEPPAGDASAKLPVIPVKREVAKVGRNDPCPCGSGKKYKHCHGK